jgi:UDP-N-acetylglucosamine 4-epimerase
MEDYKIEINNATIEISINKFLITGGAGFIGSHIVEHLINNNALEVIVLDDLSTGFISNIDKHFNLKNFEFIEGNICDYNLVLNLAKRTDYIIHLAALGSVPRSIDNPLLTNRVNIEGHLNILNAARNTKIKRVVYAASSSTYGDSKILPKKEENIGKPLSPYAVTKYVNELYSEVFFKCYGLQTIGLRFFNVFGPRQNPNGQYAAVIPLFFSSLIENKKVYINGDGTQTRDFTYVLNVVQAIERALFINDINAINQVYNVACGKNISLNNLFDEIKLILNKQNINHEYRDARKGDVKDSLADLTKISTLLRYEPLFDIKKGLRLTSQFYQETLLSNANE